MCRCLRYPGFHANTSKKVSCTTCFAHLSISRILLLSSPMMHTTVQYLHLETLPVAGVAAWVYFTLQISRTPLFSG